VPLLLAVGLWLPLWLLLLLRPLLLLLAKGEPLLSEPVGVVLLWRPGGEAGW
jgi:hypothetical protein